MFVKELPPTETKGYSARISMRARPAKSLDGAGSIALVLSSAPTSARIDKRFEMWLSRISAVAKPELSS